MEGATKKLRHPPRRTKEHRYSKETPRTQQSTRPKTPHFTSHWSADETAQKLALGQCFRGQFRVNAKNLEEAFITVKGLPHEVLVRGKLFQNRAMVGDTVALRILPPNYWWVQKSLLEISKTTNTMEKLDLNGDIYSLDDRIRRMSILRNDLKVCLERRRGGDLMRIRTASVWEHASSAEEATQLICEVLKYFPELKPTGEVVRIMQESTRRHALMGVLQMAPKNDELHFLPMDPCLPRRFVVSVESLKADRQRLIEEAGIVEKESRSLLRAEFLRWEEGEEFPSATVHDVLGSTGDIEVETTAILESRGVVDKPFSMEILESLPDENWTPAEADLDYKWDFRKQRVFTVDPLTARDLDDALSIEKIKEDRFRVGVHIADVSHFVKTGSELDKEAEKRTTSVYLVQKMIPMLPELLSSVLCSLNSGKDRLAFSVVWEISSTGEVLHHEINKSVIQSCVKLSYHHAQGVIEDPDCPLPEVEIYGGHSWEDIKKDILDLHGLGQILRQKRHENGALRLDLPKISFCLDENGLPMETQFCIQKEANQMIEEFMLLANMTVARLLADMYPTHALLRNHPPPNSKLLGELIQVAQELNVEMDISTAGTIQKGLVQLKEKLPDSDMLHAIVNLAAKPMQLAEYFCSGMIDRPHWSHFALSVDTYTHFTSPIRRYPDIIVHRLLYAAITVGTELNKRVNHDHSLLVQTTAEGCNRGKLSARNAQEDSENLFLMHWLEKRPVHTMAIVVTLKGPKFFDLYVPDFALSTRIHCEDLNGKIQTQFDRRGGLLTIDRIADDAFSEQLTTYEVPQDFEKDSHKLKVEMTVRDEKVSLHFKTGKDGIREGKQIFQEDLIPLKFPFKISRFSRVPVKVWVKKCVIFGRLMDIRVDLITENNPPTKSSFSLY